MKPISVKILRAEKRNRKIIIVLQSDLYSDETFAENPFSNEDIRRDQLDSIHFDLKITERSGNIKASVEYGNCLSHFTKGHSQLHSNLNTYYIDKKDCVKDWILTEKAEYFTIERINQVLKQWINDKDFHSEISNLIDKRKFDIKAKKLKVAQENCLKYFNEFLELATENKELENNQ